MLQCEVEAVHSANVFSGSRHGIPESVSFLSSSEAVPARRLRSPSSVKKQPGSSGLSTPSRLSSEEHEEDTVFVPSPESTPPPRVVRPSGFVTPPSDEEEALLQDIGFTYDSLLEPSAFIRFPWDDGANWTPLVPATGTPDGAHPIIQRTVVERVCLGPGGPLVFGGLQWVHVLRTLGLTDTTTQQEQYRPLASDIHTAIGDLTAIDALQIPSTAPNAAVFGKKRLGIYDRKLVYFKIQFEELPFDPPLVTADWERRYTKLLQDASLRALAIVYDFRHNFASPTHHRWDLSCMRRMIHLAAITLAIINRIRRLGQQSMAHPGPFSSLRTQIVVLPPPAFDDVMRRADAKRRALGLGKGWFGLDMSQTITQVPAMLRHGGCCGGADTWSVENEDVSPRDTSLFHHPTYLGGRSVRPLSLDSFPPHMSRPPTKSTSSHEHIPESMPFGRMLPQRESSDPPDRRHNHQPVRYKPATGKVQPVAGDPGCGWDGCEEEESQEAEEYKDCPLPDPEGVSASNTLCHNMEAEKQDLSASHRNDQAPVIALSSRHDPPVP